METCPGFDYTGVFVAFLCHDGGGNVLMAKRGPNARDEQGVWEFGGGGVEFGESPEQAVRREVAEEYGCTDIASIVALPAFSLVRMQQDMKTHWIGIPFAVQVEPTQARNNEPGIIETIEWFTLDTLPEQIHSGAQHVLTAYQKYLKEGSS